jgi:2-haloacid dehalogenase
VVSVAEIRVWKPRAEIYRHAAAVAGVAPDDLALVATHAWDVHGAKRAGLTTGFVARGQPFPAVMAAPDVAAETLGEVAAGLVALPAA